MSKVKSLSTKLIILLIAAVLVPLSLYGALSIGTSRHYNFKVITEGNSNVARRAAAEIDLYVTNSIAILNALSQNIGRFNIPAHEQELILSNYVLNFPELRQIAITDREGGEIISTDGKSLENRSRDVAYQTAIKGEIYKSEVFISTNMAPSMTIAMPVKRLNTMEGVAIADISLIAMWRLVDSIKIGKSGYAFVVSGDGRLIAHGLGDGKVRVLSHENMKSLGIVNGVLQGRHSTGLSKNIEGTEVIGVAAPVPSLGWGIVIEEPLTEAYAPVRRMTILLALLIILFVAAASATGYAGNRRYILQPIRTLISATRRIAGGNFDEKVPIATGDELQEVGNAFNNMMYQLKILQEDIRRNERIAFMNKIAASLVHDLRHPIKNIESSSKLIMDNYDKEEHRNTFRRVVTREFSNINRFLEDLLELARPVHLNPIALNICSEIRGILEMFREETGKKGIEIATVFPDDSVGASADKFSIERVFKNIIRNAIDAMPAGGTLKISVSSTHDATAIEFRDTGCGIPQDKLENLFTEFTTTKRSGLGLGLAMSKRIIDAHNGTITVESEIGKGTAFTIRLPAAPL